MPAEKALRILVDSKPTMYSHSKAGCCHLESGQMLEQVAQRSCGVPSLKIFKTVCP